MTTAEQIEIAKVSGFLVTNDIQRSGLVTQLSNRSLPRQIYMVRKNVEWMYDLDPTDDTLFQTGRYLYALCGKYANQASAIINAGGGGTVVTPSTGTTAASSIGWVRITSADFDTATNYVDTDLANITYRIFANWLNRYLEPGTEWEYLAGGGFTILISGFDALTYADYEMYLDAKGDLSSDAQGGVAYDLTGVTVIPNLAAGDSYDTKTISIKPNGYSYTWDTDYLFSDSWPEQPGATGVNTLQIYTFRYIPSQLKWVCVEQSINIAI